MEASEMLSTRWVCRREWVSYIWAAPPLHLHMVSPLECPTPSFPAFLILSIRQGPNQPHFKFDQTSPVHRDIFLYDTSLVLCILAHNCFLFVYMVSLLYPSCPGNSIGQHMLTFISLTHSFIDLIIYLLLDSLTHYSFIYSLNQSPKVLIS